MFVEDTAGIVGYGTVVFAESLSVESSLASLVLVLDSAVVLVRRTEAFVAPGVTSSTPTPTNFPLEIPNLLMSSYRIRSHWIRQGDTICPCYHSWHDLNTTRLSESAKNND